MGTQRVRYLIERRGGFYFQATPRMRAAGIFSEALGTDRARAIARAVELAAAWDATREGVESGPAPVPGTVSAFIAELRASTAWTDKAPRTIEELDYVMGVIEPVFGPTPLPAVTPEHCQAFYDALRRTGSVHRAKKVFKWLRWLFHRAEATWKIPKTPASAVAVEQPLPRQTIWTPGQVEAYVAAAEAMGYAGVALVAAIIYDTSLRSGDARTLPTEAFREDRVGPFEQAKTGRPAMLPLWPETSARIEAYKRSLGATLLPGTPQIGRAHV